MAKLEPKPESPYTPSSSLSTAYIILVEKIPWSGESKGISTLLFDKVHSDWNLVKCKKNSEKPVTTLISPQQQKTEQGPLGTGRCSCLLNQESWIGNQEAVCNFIFQHFETNSLKQLIQHILLFLKKFPSVFFYILLLSSFSPVFIFLCLFSSLHYFPLYPHLFRN